MRPDFNKVKEIAALLVDNDPTAFEKLKEFITTNSPTTSVDVSDEKDMTFRTVIRETTKSLHIYREKGRIYLIHRIWLGDQQRVNDSRMFTSSNSDQFHITLYNNLLNTMV